MIDKVKFKNEMNKLSNGSIDSAIANVKEEIQIHEQILNELINSGADEDKINDEKELLDKYREALDAFIRSKEL